MEATIQGFGFWATFFWNLGFKVRKPDYNGLQYIAMGFIRGYSTEPNHTTGSLGSRRPWQEERF